MVLDVGSILGEVAYFEDGLTSKSACEIAALPNPRLVKLTEVRAVSCGSAVYAGRYSTADVWVSVKITDHRMRMCMDAVAGLVVVEFTNGLTGVTQVLVSVP